MMEFFIRRIFLVMVGSTLLLTYILYSSSKSADYLDDMEEVLYETETTSKKSGSVCHQKMSAANITNFTYFPESMQDFLYYRHCRRFPLLLNSPAKCGRTNWSEEVFLLLVIKSSPDNYARREVLRKTWAKERQINGVWVRRVFIAGTTGDGFEKIRLNKLLRLEQREHRDIIQWDFKDTLYNLSLKQVLFMEWLDKNCPNALFLLNGDDDMFAHTENVVDYLQSLEDVDGSRNLFAGFLQTNATPIRDMEDKYFVPNEIYRSNLYPPYCSGGGILLSRYTAWIMHRMSESVPLFPIDDVFLGMCMAKTEYNLTFHVGVRTFGVMVPSEKMDELDPCFYTDMLLVHRFLPTQMYIMWHRVHDPKLRCFLKEKSKPLPKRNTQKN